MQVWTYIGEFGDGRNTAATNLHCVVYFLDTDIPASSLRYLIFHPKSRTVFWLALAPVIQACRGYVSVPQPLLNLGNIGIMR